MNHTDRTIRLSKVLAVVALAAAGLVLVGFLLTFVLPDGTTGIRRALLLGAGDPVLIDPINLGLLAAVLAAPLLAILYALWSMFRLFQTYASGEIFSGAACKALAGIGRSVVTFVPLQIIATGLGSFIVTRHAPPEQQRVIIALDVSDVLVLVLGGLLWVIGWIIAEATRIADENRSII
jgi:hydrogenase/urease accessory protein HupE